MPRFGERVYANRENGGLDPLIQLNADERFRYSGHQSRLLVRFLYKKKCTMADYLINTTDLNLTLPIFSKIQESVEEGVVDDSGSWSQIIQISFGVIGAIISIPLFVFSFTRSTYKVVDDDFRDNIHEIDHTGNFFGVLSSFRGMLLSAGAFLVAFKIIQNKISIIENINKIKDEYESKRLKYIVQHKKNIYLLRICEYINILEQSLQPGGRILNIQVITDSIRDLLINLNNDIFHDNLNIDAIVPKQATYILDKEELILKLKQVILYPEFLFNQNQKINSTLNSEFTLLPHELLTQISIKYEDFYRGLDHKTKNLYTEDFGDIILEVQGIDEVLISVIAELSVIKKYHCIGDLFVRMDLEHDPVTDVLQAALNKFRKPYVPKRTGDLLDINYSKFAKMIIDRLKGPDCVIGDDLDSSELPQLPNPYVPLPGRDTSQPGRFSKPVPQPSAPSLPELRLPRLQIQQDGLLPVAGRSAVQPNISSIPISDLNDVKPGDLTSSDSVIAERKYNCYLRKAFIARLRLKPDLTKTNNPQVPQQSIGVGYISGGYCVYMPEPLSAMPALPPGLV